MDSRLSNPQLDLLIRLHNSVVTLAQFDFLFPAESRGFRNEYLLYFKRWAWIQIRGGAIVFVAPAEDVSAMWQCQLDEKWMAINRAGISLGLKGDNLDYYVVQNLPEILYQENHQQHELVM
jgi:hypothetical protein